MKEAAEVARAVQVFSLIVVAACMFALVAHASSIDASLRRIAAQGPVKVETPIHRVEAQGLPALNGMGMQR